MIIAEIFKPGKEAARFRVFAQELERACGPNVCCVFAVVDNALIN